MNTIKIYNKFRILMNLIRRGDWQYIKMRSSFYFSSTSIYGRIFGIKYNSLNRRKGVLLGPVTVAPNGSRWFRITGIKSEKIRITISHSDSFIKESRKSIIVEIDCRMKGNKGVARSMGLNFNGKNAFQYMGGGHVREGIFQQVADIRIPANMSELRFRIRPLVDRHVNIDDLTISSDETVGLTKERPPPN
ncbi:hypothetical protein [Nitratireductor sp. OM-1]|uniref:hypothetical protein n=1 Tax=Nitratireductor sp. OM-1 TaxID=1756988 RepID=UPI0013AF043D|nr:hypothetical protein [Nitratireductor sp. OM-1]